MDHIIDCVRDFIKACPAIKQCSQGVYVDFTKAEKMNFGIMPTGQEVIERYMDGEQTVQYTFSLMARKFTASDADRLENSGFIEAFEKWLEEQSELQGFIKLPAGCIAISISCSNCGLLDLSENGKTGLYQIPCQLIYERTIKYEKTPEP